MQRLYPEIATKTKRKCRFSHSKYWLGVNTVHQVFQWCPKLHIWRNYIWSWEGRLWLLDPPYLKIKYWFRTIQNWLDFWPKFKSQCTPLVNKILCLKNERTQWSMTVKSIAIKIIFKSRGPFITYQLFSTANFSQRGLNWLCWLVGRSQTAPRIWNNLYVRTIDYWGIVHIIFCLQVVWMKRLLLNQLSATKN